MERNNAPGRLKQVLGEALVTDEKEELKKYGASISGTTLLPSCIVYPTDTTSVLQLIKIANENGFQLYPISRGKNYGYGEAQGTNENQVIVDLSRMNKILEVNEKLAYIKIQPGVSQHQLYNYIKSNNINLQLDVTGAGLESSIVGNILERGFGHTDYGDRFARIINLTIVTPNGEIIQTGFGNVKNADGNDVYRYGIGPNIEGLFSQSNFGIVTEMTLELMPRPEKMLMFVFSTKSVNEIGNLVLAIRELKLNGIVNSAIHIANKTRTIGGKENKLIGAWNMSGSICGPPLIVRAKKKIIKRVISKHIRSHQLWFIGDNFMSFLKWIHHHIKPIPVYDTLKREFDLQNGVPTDVPLQTLLNDETLNSSHFSSGDYQTCFSWINAVCKADEKSVSLLINTVEKLFADAGYEFRVTFTAINPRTLIMIANISYPRNEADISKAKSFCTQCATTLNELGFYPYRAGSGMYDKVPVFNKAYTSLIKNIKSVLDPNDIIAPGKYNI